MILDMSRLLEVWGLLLLQINVKNKNYDISFRIIFYSLVDMAANPNFYNHRKK